MAKHYNSFVLTVHSAQGKHNETEGLASHVQALSHTSQCPSLIAAELAGSSNAPDMQCDATELQELLNNRQSIPAVSELLVTVSLPTSHPPNPQAQVSLPIPSA